MWRNHMSIHANGTLPGAVPSEWLLAQNLFVCPHCYQLVANSRHSTHLQQCTQSQIVNISHSFPSIQDSNQELPTFAEECQLNHPTLRFVLAKARPAFAWALSSTLKDILLHNTEETWLKLFMLPKCVLPSLKHKGVTNPHTSVESLCKLWLDNDLITLWAMAKNRAKTSAPQRVISHLITPNKLSPLLFPWAKQGYWAKLVESCCPMALLQSLTTRYTCYKTSILPAHFLYL